MKFVTSDYVVDPTTHAKLEFQGSNGSVSPQWWNIHIRSLFFLSIYIIKQNWNQFLLVVKATALKQQISKFYPPIQLTDASDHIYVSQWPVKQM